MSKKRNCLCCGQEYEYCSNCNDTKKYPTWMAEFDKEACKEVFNVVSAYNSQLVGIEDVKAVVKKYNITDFGKYKKSIKDKLNEIVGDNKPKTESVEEKKTVVENKPKADFSDKQKSETKRIFKPFNNNEANAK